MKNLVLWMTPVVLVAQTGCFDMRSVYPLYTDKTAVAEPMLPGSWQSANGKEELVVRESGDREYIALYVSEKGEVAKYEVHVVMFGDIRVADLLPLTGDDMGIPAHYFVQLELGNNNLKVKFLDSGALREKARAEGFAYTRDKDCVALVAPTAALRGLIEKNLPSEEKKDIDAEFVRVK